MGGALSPKRLRFWLLTALNLSLSYSATLFVETFRAELIDPSPTEAEKAARLRVAVLRELALTAVWEAVIVAFIRSRRGRR